MQVISSFEPKLATILPDTNRVLQSAQLVVHPAVQAVLLYGSRGPRGGARADSDLDLCLLAHIEHRLTGSALRRLLRDVLEATLVYWTGVVVVDPVVVYDTRDCGLDCFRAAGEGRAATCSVGGRDCFGLFRLRRAGGQFVMGKGVDMGRMQPMLTVWRHPVAGRPAGSSA
jgi:predicted nucleotidyltransferase